MQLEDQVISLDNAKKLKELGVKQDSFVSYIFYKKSRYELKISNTGFDYQIQYSAFTAAELLEIFPNINGNPIIIKKIYNFSEDIYYFCHYEHLEEIDVYCSDKNPANACAKMLIYLIENKLIEVKNDNN